MLIYTQHTMIITNFILDSELANLQYNAIICRTSSPTLTGTSN